MAVEIDYIKRVKMFGKLSEDDQRHLARISAMRNYSQGDVIFSEGEKGKELYIINRGIIKIKKKIETAMQENETQTLTKVRSGDHFGEFTFFEGGTHSASAIAAGDVSLLVLSRDDFNKLIKEVPRLGYKIMQEMTVSLGELLREMNKRLTGLVSYMYGEKS